MCWPQAERPDEGPAHSWALIIRIIFFSSPTIYLPFDAMAALTFNLICCFMSRSETPSLIGLTSGLMYSQEKKRRSQTLRHLLPMEGPRWPFGSFDGGSVVCSISLTHLSHLNRNTKQMFAWFSSWSRNICPPCQIKISRIFPPHKQRFMSTVTFSVVWFLICPSCQSQWCPITSGP